MPKLKLTDKEFYVVGLSEIVKPVFNRIGENKYKSDYLARAIEVFKEQFKNEYKEITKTKCFLTEYKDPNDSIEAQIGFTNPTGKLKELINEKVNR